MVSDQLFFSFAISMIGIVVAFAIAIITVLHSINSKVSSFYESLSNTNKTLSEIVGPFRAIGTIIQQKGIEGLAQDLVTSLRGIRPKKAKDPLSAEKITRRNELIEYGKKRKLTEEESKELKAILEEEAGIQFAEGVISFLGFLAILGLIGLFIAALTSSRD